MADSNSISRLSPNFCNLFYDGDDYNNSIDPQSFPPSVESRDELFGNTFAMKLEGGRDTTTGATKESEFISQDGLPLGLQRYSQSEFKFSAEDGLQILEQVDCFRFLVDEDSLNAAIEKGTALKVDQLVLPNTSPNPNPNSNPNPPLSPSFLLDSSIVQALSLDSQEVKKVYMDMDAFRDGVAPILPTPTPLPIPIAEEDEVVGEGGEDLGKLLEDYSEHFRSKSLLGRLGLQSRLEDTATTTTTTTTGRKSSAIWRMVVYAWWRGLRLHEILADQLGAVFVMSMATLTLTLAGTVQVGVHTALQILTRQPTLKRIFQAVVARLGQRGVGVAGIMCIGATIARASNRKTSK